MHTYIHLSKNCDCFFIITAYACFMGINIILALSENVNYLNTKSCTSILLLLAPLLLVQTLLGVPGNSWYLLFFEFGILVG